MTRKDYVELFKSTCEQMVALTEKKNADYSGHSDDAFANFKLIEAYGVTTSEVGIFVRMSDKMSRIASFMKKGELQVKDESVEDTLKDLAVYSIILQIKLKENKLKEVQK